jgi:hypothetical protein
MHFFVKNVTFFLLNGYFMRPRMDVAPGSSGPRKNPEKTLSEARKPRTYRVLISHLSRTKFCTPNASVLYTMYIILFGYRKYAIKVKRDKKNYVFFAKNREGYCIYEKLFVLL